VPETILCPLPTSVYQPGCSTVAVNPSESARMDLLLIKGDNRGVAGTCTGLARPAYLSRFLCSALPCVAPFCAPGGVRVVSTSPFLEASTRSGSVVGDAPSCPVEVALHLQTRCSSEASVDHRPVAGLREVPAIPIDPATFIVRRSRLRRSSVPILLMLRNSRNVPIYLLCFAAGNPTGAPMAVRIAGHLLGR
jgi:hypothetical protein